MPSFNLADVLRPLSWPSNEEQALVCRQFVAAWRELARNQLGLPDMLPRAVELEQQFLLSLLTVTIPEMAQAVALRQVDVQRDLISTMRTLVDGLERLYEVEESVRYECMSARN